MDIENMAQNLLNRFEDLKELRKQEAKGEDVKDKIKLLIRIITYNLDILTIKNDHYNSLLARITRELDFI